MWLCAAKRRRRGRAKWRRSGWQSVVCLCYSTTRLVRVCLIISCLTSRVHRVSMIMVWCVFRTKRSSFLYAYYSDYKRSASLVTQFCMAGGRKGGVCACAANWHLCGRALFLVGGTARCDRVFLNARYYLHPISGLHERSGLEVCCFLPPQFSK